MSSQEMRVLDVEVENINPREELAKANARGLIRLLAKRSIFVNDRVNSLMKGLAGGRFLDDLDFDLSVDSDLEVSGFRVTYLKDDGRPRYELVIPERFAELTSEGDVMSLEEKKRQLVGFLKACYHVRWRTEEFSDRREKACGTLKDEFCKKLNKYRGIENLLEELKKISV